MGLTHAETAWTVNLPIVAVVAIASIMAYALAMTRMGIVGARILDWHRSITKRRPGAPIELIYRPDIMPPHVLTAMSLIAMIIGAAIGSLIGSIAVSLAAAAILTGLTIAASIAIAEQRYIQRLESALPQQVGRLAVQMRAGQGFNVALETVVADLSDGPLKREWRWVLDTIGSPTSSGLATDSHVCGALARQTPSRRHAAFMVHLEAALRAAHQERTRMIEAAYDSMMKSQQRMSLISAELAQMRNSGVVLFLANIVIIGYLAVVQTSRFVAAYASEFGIIVGPLIAAVMLAPLIGGHVLSRFDDVMY